MNSFYQIFTLSEHHVRFEELQLLENDHVYQFAVRKISVEDDYF